MFKTFARSLAVLALLGFGLAAEGVSAKPVAISGTHSPNEIAGKCGAVGGVYSADSGGFRCDNIVKGTQVDCNTDGHCTGTVPDRVKKPNTETHIAVGGVKAMQ